MHVGGEAHPPAVWVRAVEREGPGADRSAVCAHAVGRPDRRGGLFSWCEIAVGCPVPVRQADVRVSQNPLQLQFQQDEHEPVPGQEDRPAVRGVAVSLGGE